MNPLAPFQSVVTMLRLHASHGLVLGLLSLLMLLVACDRQTPEEQATASKHAELKQRLDRLIEESDEQMATLEAQRKRMEEKQKESADRLARILAQADDDGKRTAEGNPQPRSLSSYGVGEATFHSNGPTLMLDDSLTPEQKQARARQWAMQSFQRRALTARVRTMDGVAAAVKKLGGQVMDKRTYVMAYCLSDERMPWTALYTDGSLVLSLRLGNLPDDPQVYADIRRFAKSDRHASKVEYTFERLPDNTKLWFMEVSRTLSSEELENNPDFASHLAGVERDHQALLAELMRKRPDLLSHLQPVMHNQVIRASLALDREPTEADMLQAMRNHFASRLGRKVFRITGVEKLACKQIAPYTYRCVYVPQLAPEHDDWVSLVLAMSPRGKNLATFTYAGGRWHFSGAE